MQGIGYIMRFDDYEPLLAGCLAAFVGKVKHGKAAGGRKVKCACFADVRVVQLGNTDDGGRCSGRDELGIRVAKQRGNRGVAVARGLKKFRCINGHTT